MNEFSIGDKVKHKVSDKLMVVIGFSKKTIKIVLAAYSQDTSLPYVVCEYLEECNKKTEIFLKTSLEKA
ncbi:hypothetical protein CH370_14570 [Leptospira kmetyi]|uniref:hypothetical protein n=1 Tax=Leptospira kmetyi TaxID=408139 RepID=UPI000C2A665E|nr:hypothetical protein [Leptospira kmetyi]PJZ40961.1 hypothetical protein CH370_14570 [Leptospira kmetyi]